MSVREEDELWLSSPRGIAFRGDALLVADTLTGALLELDTGIR